MDSLSCKQFCNAMQTKKSYQSEKCNCNSHAVFDAALLYLARNSGQNGQLFKKKKIFLNGIKPALVLLHIIIGNNRTRTVRLCGLHTHSSRIIVRTLTVRGRHMQYKFFPDNIDLRMFINFLWGKYYILFAAICVLYN